MSTGPCGSSRRKANLTALNENQTEHLASLSLRVPCFLGQAEMQTKFGVCALEHLAVPGIPVVASTGHRALVQRPASQTASEETACWTQHWLLLSSAARSGCITFRPLQNDERKECSGERHVWRKRVQSFAMYCVIRCARWILKAGALKEGSKKCQRFKPAMSVWAGSAVT